MPAVLCCSWQTVERRSRIKLKWAALIYNYFISPSSVKLIPLSPAEQFYLLHGRSRGLLIRLLFAPWIKCDWKPLKNTFYWRSLLGAGLLCKSRDKIEIFPKNLLLLVWRRLVWGTAREGKLSDHDQLAKQWGILSATTSTANIRVKSCPRSFIISISRVWMDHSSIMDDDCLSVHFRAHIVFKLSSLPSTRNTFTSL